MQGRKPCHYQVKEAVYFSVPLRVASARCGVQRRDRPTAPPGYDNNPGRLEAQSHTGKCDGYDGTATTTGAGAGGFGYQQGQGNNQAGGRQGEPNYNPLICGNPNDAALTQPN